MQPNSVQSGDKIGRFVVVEQLGAGGSGQVFAAYDPKLDRKVALKVISARTEEDQLRISREARALAQLNHPNVLHVHEIDQDQHWSFIVTELIDGGDLRGWLEQPRDWRAIVEVFIQAAQGLMAAHDIGLVHRDFKPANVLITQSGQVQVADFGLAKSHVEATEAPQAGEDADLLAAHLTQTGVYSGTPAYMAPEQWQDGYADALSDQFSYACALYEALYGELPFAGKTPAEHLHTMQTGPLEPLELRGVPQSVRKILLKALAVDPQQRFADMQTLVAQLNAALRFRGRALSVAATVVAVGVVAALLTFREAPELCKVPDVAGSAWNTEQQGAMQRAFLAVDNAILPAVFNQISLRIEDKITGWNQAYLKSCENTRVYGRQSEQVLDQQMLCLHKQEQQFISLAEVFLEPNESVVNNAVRAVDAILPAESCLDVESQLLRTPLPKDAATVQLIEDQKRQMAQVQVLFDTGQPQAALQKSQQLDQSIQSHSYYPVHAEHWFQKGMLESRLDEFDTASATLLQAQFLGLMSGRFDVALQAISEWLWQEAYLRGNTDQSVNRQLHRANVMVQLDAVGDQARSAYHRSYGSILQNQGELDAAIREHKQAVEYAKTGHGVPSFKYAASMFNLGNAQRINGQIEDAKSSYQNAARAFESSVGDSHPVAGTVVSTLAGFLLEQGFTQEAIAEHQRALNLSKGHYGEINSQHAVIYQNLGVAYLALPDFEKARDHYLLALENLESVGDQSWGDDVYVGLAESYIGLQQPEKALTALRKTEEIVADKPASYVHANLLFLRACALHQSGAAVVEVLSYLDYAETAIQEGFERHLVDSLRARISYVRSAVQENPNSPLASY